MASRRSRTAACPQLGPDWEYVPKYRAARARPGERDRLLREGERLTWIVADPGQARPAQSGGQTGGIASPAHQCQGSISALPRIFYVSHEGKYRGRGSQCPCAIIVADPGQLGCLHRLAQRRTCLGQQAGERLAHDQGDVCLHTRVAGGDAVAESAACQLLGELDVAAVLESIEGRGPEDGDPLFP